MEITLPYKFTPRSYQLPLLRAMDNGYKRAVITWHRRGGKDKTCFNYMIKEAMGKVGTYYYFLPTYTQAKKVIWENIDNDGFKMLDHIPKEIIKKTNDTELKVELINGSIIQLIAADTFEKSGVGSNPIGVVFSEYSVTNNKSWDFVRPILRANGGWAIFNFTPRGMNHAFNLLQIARDNKDTWFNEVLTIKDTNVLTEEDIEQERREGMPEDMIDQEYYCKFIEGAGSFFRRIMDNRIEPSDKVLPNHKYQGGVDLAKYQDYTVITKIDLNTFHVNQQDRFNQIDWNLQKAKIEASYLRYNKPLLNMDSTGLGDPIYDDLVKKGLNVFSYKFTESSRRDLLVNLQLLLEQGKIKIPDDPILIGELQAMHYEISDSGKIKIVVPEGLHDDCIMSLALACWNLPTNPLPLPGSIRFLNRNVLDKHEQTSYE